MHIMQKRRHAVLATLGRSMTTQRMLICSACMMLMALAAACGGSPSPASATGTPLSSRSADAMANPAVGGGGRSNVSAWDVVRALSHAGLRADNALDTTAQECPGAGCDQAVVTDELRVKSFDGPSRAHSYASARGLEWVGSIVVAFAPPMPPPEREAYWREIVELAS